MHDGISALDEAIEHHIELVHLDYEYKREGVATIYMLCEPLDGYRAVRITESQDRLSWARVVAHLLEEVYPEAEQITLVQDNLSTHTKKSTRLSGLDGSSGSSKLCGPRSTNIAEMELSVLSRQCLSTRIPNASILAEHVAAWERTRNQNQKGVDWQFTTADARIKLKRLYPSIIT